MLDKLYYYTISSYDYDNIITKEYYSTNKHFQNEFESIVFKVMEQLMNEIITDTPSSLCYYNIFFQADDLVLEDRFDELMAENELHRLSDKINARMYFGGNEPNRNDDKLLNIFKQLTIDETCKDKNCCRIKDLPDDEKYYLSKHCGVAIRNRK